MESILDSAKHNADETQTIKMWQCEPPLKQVSDRSKGPGKEYAHKAALPAAISKAMV